LLLKGISEIWPANIAAGNIDTAAVAEKLGDASPRAQRLLRTIYESQMNER